MKDLIKNYLETIKATNDKETFIKNAEEVAKLLKNEYEGKTITEKTHKFLWNVYFIVSDKWRTMKFDNKQEYRVSSTLYNILKLHNYER